jgi:hypothetical protein
MSGPHSPQDPTNLLASFAMRSGPRSPQDPSIRTMSATAGHDSPVNDSYTVEATAEKVSIRVEIRKPEPIAVALSSPDPMKIELKKIEIEIYTKRQNKRELVFSIPISDASDQVVEDASKPRVFPLNYQELQNLMPHLKVGNTAVVVVEYLAQTYGELHISVIGKSQEHETQEIVQELSEAK